MKAAEQAHSHSEDVIRRAEAGRPEDEKSSMIRRNRSVTPDIEAAASLFKHAMPVNGGRQVLDHGYINIGERRFSFGAEIGSSPLSRVHAVRDGDGADLAAKFPAPNTPEAAHFVDCDIDARLALRQCFGDLAAHRIVNIVHHGPVMSPGPFFGMRAFVMPRFAANCQDALRDDGPLPEFRRRIATPAGYLGFARDLMTGIAATATIDAGHRDIKPSNMETDGCNLFLNDFGAFKIYLHVTQSIGCATPKYMAPEVRTAWHHAMATGGAGSTPAARPGLAPRMADMFSAGVVLHEFLLRRIPRRQHTTLFQPIEAGELLDADEAQALRHACGALFGVPVDPSRTLLAGGPGTGWEGNTLEHLIRACLSMDPKRRPTAAAALEVLRRLRNAQAPCDVVPPPVAERSPATGQRQPAAPKPPSAEPPRRPSSAPPSIPPPARQRRSLRRRLCIGAAGVAAGLVAAWGELAVSQERWPLEVRIRMADAGFWSGQPGDPVHPLCLDDQGRPAMPAGQTLVLRTRLNDPSPFGSPPTLIVVDVAERGGASLHLPVVDLPACRGGIDDPAGSVACQAVPLGLPAQRHVVAVVASRGQPQRPHRLIDRLDAGRTEGGPPLDAATVTRLLAPEAAGVGTLTVETLPDAACRP